MDVDTYANEYTAKQQAKKAASEQVQYSLDELINPEDVDETADTWEDVDEDLLREEIGICMEHMRNEDQIPAIYDLAIVLWRESLPRVPMDHLVFEDRETAVREGYWPYAMSRTYVTDVLWEYSEEYEWFHEYLDEAESVLHPYIEAALHPLKDPADVDE